MPKSSQLRLIFEELRRAAGPDAAAGDLIRLAHLIQRAYVFEPSAEEDFGRDADNRQFASLPLDVAMRDGGWRVLSFEEERAHGLQSCDIVDFEFLHRRISSFLGPEWQQRIPQG